MKALIPVAGAGTRLRPHTFTQPKPLIPVAGKPIIAFIIDELIQAGIREFVFVIGYLGDRIEDFMADRYPDLKVTFVHQHQRLGLGHAVWTARELFQPDDEVFIVLGDTIFDANIKDMLEQPTSCIGLKKVDDPRKFGVAELDNEGFVKSLIEKPKIPRSNLAIVGLYKIKEVKLLMDALQYNIDNNIRTVEEFQLTDGLMRLINQGIKIRSINVGNWHDCGRKEILLETNATLLKRSSYNTSELPFRDNTIFIHPVCIGKNCTFKNAIIGPNVTIGDNTNITNAVVRDSIIGSDTFIEDAVLHLSVVGSDSVIKGRSQSLNIGDNTEIDFS